MHISSCEDGLLRKSVCNFLDRLESPVLEGIQYINILLILIEALGLDV